jgi:hypothetical protein
MRYTPEFLDYYKPFCVELYQSSGWDDTTDHYYEGNGVKIPFYDHKYLWDKLPGRIVIKGGEFAQLHLEKLPNAASVYYKPSMDKIAFNMSAPTAEEALLMMATYLIDHGYIETKRD